MPDSAIDPYTVRHLADSDETPSKASNLATPTESAIWRTLQGNVADSEGTHRSTDDSRMTHG